MNTFKKFIVLAGFMIGSALYAAVSVSELQNKEKEMYAILSEYWIDKAGDVHVGNKDPKELQFAFSETLMPRLTIKQITDSMATAISKFDKSKQDAFASAVQPYLTELTNARIELQAQRKTMDDAAAALAPLLGKSVQDILKLPDQNITTLISTKITDGAKKVSAHQAAATLKKMRPQFSVQTVEQAMPTTTASAFDSSVTTTSGDKTKSSAGTKAAAIAQGLANSDFKISSVVKFAGEAYNKGMVRDRHFDIMLDSTGLHFTTIAN